MSEKSTSTEYKVQHSYHQFLLDVAAHLGQAHTKQVLIHLLKEMQAGHINGISSRVDDKSHCGCIIAHIGKYAGRRYTGLLQAIGPEHLETDMDNPWETHLIDTVHGGDTPASNPELAKFYAWTAEFLGTLS